MKSLSHTIKKTISRNVWRGIWHVQRKRWWVIHTTVLFASAFLMLKASQLPEDEKTFLWFPVIFWQGVAASAFAAALVSIFQLLAITTDKAEDKYFEAEALKFKKAGLLDVFAERGTALASESYRSRIRVARERIWAIGMTNGKLIKDHGPDIIEAAAKNRGLDVIVAFWNPRAKLVYGNLDMSISDVQAMIENGTLASSNTQSQIETRQAVFRADIEKRQQTSKFKGRIRIANICMPANFTAFVFDEDVFFFPFIAATTSAVTPTLLAATDEMLGMSVVKHFEKLLNEDGAVLSRLVEFVFDSNP